ncbi:peptidase A8 [Vallitalea longa]|uniref:Peptidase A8 n=1 Tax=Vallitalea longa TaxID=2936439 RepID=A0A9W5YF81_9FIRM|nr:signal peptidase II [Vallitalea longa]GKX30103.1 peptidase A8 [Vallitalea longa]
MKKYVNRNLLLIIIYVMIDQLIKIYIDSYNLNYHDLTDVIAFRPVLNDRYSYVNNVFNCNMGIELHIILITLALIVIIIFYKYILAENNKSKELIVGFNLLIAGCICSLIDKFFWSGSLDYIWLKGFFIFDLKDVYISISEVIIITWVIINYKLVIHFRTRDLIRFIKESIIKQ